MGPMGLVGPTSSDEVGSNALRCDAVITHTVSFLRRKIVTYPETEIISQLPQTPTTSNNYEVEPIRQPFQLTNNVHITCFVGPTNTFFQVGPSGSS